jgi:hypothetical protein
MERRDYYKLRAVEGNIPAVYICNVVPLKKGHTIQTMAPYNLS